MNLNKYYNLSIEELEKYNFSKVLEWVAWIIKNQEGDLLLVLENTEKSWKKADQWSFLMEWMEEWETKEETIIRWVKEELWLDNIDKKQIFNKNLTLPFIVYDSKKEVLVFVKLHVFEIYLNDKQISQALKQNSDEIKEAKLFKEKEIYDIVNLRPWVKEVLKWKIGTTIIKDWEYLYD